MRGCPHVWRCINNKKHKLFQSDLTGLLVFAGQIEAYRTDLRALNIASLLKVTGDMVRVRLSHARVRKGSQYDASRKNPVMQGYQRGTDAASAPLKQDPLRCLAAGEEPECEIQISRNYLSRSRGVLSNRPERESVRIQGRPKNPNTLETLKARRP
eukprot:4356898-Pyramimonas_sp.AAC.1